MNTYAIFLTLTDGRKRFDVNAKNMYEAIDEAVRINGGKLWLAYETAESQQRR